MKKVTVKHLTKDEITKCNSLLNSVANVNSCLYQAIEKAVFEFVNAKEAMLHQEKNFNEFKNNASLFCQVNAAFEKATVRFQQSRAMINSMFIVSQ